MYYNRKNQRVRIAQMLTRFSIASPTQRKRKLIEKEKVIENAFGKLTIKYTERLIARDLKVFVALATYIHENKDQVVECIVNGKKLLSVNLDMYSFVKKYLHKQPSKNVYNAVLESLRVLARTYLEGEMTFKSKDKTTTAKINTSILPLVETIEEEEEEGITIVKEDEDKDKKTKTKIQTRIWIFKWTLEMLTSEYALLLDNYYLQRTNTSTSTLLYIFLTTQSQATSYSKSFLVKQLGLEEVEENRHALRELKNAFKDLQKIGYIKNWHIEESGDDIYFVFSRNDKSLKDKH